MQAGKVPFKYDINTLIKTSKAKTCKTSQSNIVLDNQKILPNKRQLSHIVDSQNQKMSAISIEEQTVSCLFDSEKTESEFNIDHQEIFKKQNS